MRTLINTEILELTVPANNTITGNTRHLEGMLGQVLVKGPTDVALFDIKITNNRSLVIYERVGETEPLADATLQIPILGIYTIELSNATEGAFTVELMQTS